MKDPLEFNASDFIECEESARPDGCGGKIVKVKPMTLYGDEPEFYLMCKEHRDDYVEHWNSMWEDYNSGRM